MFHSRRLKMNSNKVMTRRDLLKMIGYSAGATAMLTAMGNLGHASTISPMKDVNLSGMPKGSKIIVLGGGVAGLVAAYEFKRAGYEAVVIEAQNRPGGRAWSVSGGDEYVDTDDITQTCEFEKGQFFNLGAWRIPYYHKNILHYCRELDIKLDPFVQMNFNAYLQSDNAFDGKPQRFREVFTDFNGGISELLAKATNQKALDEVVSEEDKAILLEALQSFGALDKDYKYTESVAVSMRRGFEKLPGGGLSAGYSPTKPIDIKAILDSRLWSHFAYFFTQQFQQTMFEPRGGMSMIGQAFEKALPGIIRYNSEVTEIHQTEDKVTATFVNKTTGETETVTGDWCLCTIPTRILSKIKMNVGKKLQAAIESVNYESVVKLGVQYKRRFWEEDEAIFGGMSLTSLPITHFAYPSSPNEFLSSGKGVTLTGYIAGDNSRKFTAMSLKERLEQGLNYASKIHPQVIEEFDNGYSVAWDKVPWILGGYSQWTPEVREQHYQDLCEIDGRIALAGEHASYMNGWLEGAVTSSIDAISRIHAKATS